MNITCLPMSARVALLILFLVPSFLVAQQPDPEGRRERPDTFNFGPPLRSKFLFAYKYTERVRTNISVDGEAFDSTERTLTYFMTMRQRMAEDGSNRVAIELNVDSMQVDFRSAGETLKFHTQHLQGEDWNMVRHREVLVPSALVNRMLTFDLSSYGDILNIVSPALEDVREQGNVQGVDAFTRARVAEMTSDAYVSSILLPWRCALPLGATVPVGTPAPLRNVPLTLDRIAFRGDLNATIEFGSDGLPLARFDARLDSVVTPTMTLLQFDEPLRVTGGEGSLSGQLKMQEDGVVIGGWSVARGTIRATRGGQEVVEQVVHEVFIESMGVISYSG